MDFWRGDIVRMAHVYGVWIGSFTKLNGDVFYVAETGPGIVLFGEANKFTLVCKAGGYPELVKIPP